MQIVKEQIFFEGIAPHIGIGVFRMETDPPTLKKV